jgi:hypothetical protein
LLASCSNAGKYPGVYFRTEAMNLKWAEEYWVSQGRPADFDPGKLLGPTNVFFVFTNEVTITNTLFHCRFGVRESEWPAGVLAVTDGGIIVWIRDRDGKVIVSPEINGVEP